MVQNEIFAYRDDKFVKNYLRGTKYRGITSLSGHDRKHITLPEDFSVLGSFHLIIYL